MLEQLEPSTNELFDRLEVTAPYLALDSVKQTVHGEWMANIYPEQPQYQEAGSIAASEVGRHLALLGSIAIAAQNPAKGKHYYLATTATLRNLTERSSVTHPTLSRRLQGVVHSSSISGKTAQAAAAIYSSNNQPLFQLETTYQILGERLFERMFKGFRKASVPTYNISPYALKTSLEVTSLTEHMCSTEFTAVTLAQCAGHFPHYPSLPVAILMQRLSRVAGALFAYRTGTSEHGYIVNHAEIRANHLAFAGELLRFEAEFLSHEGDGMRFVCRAVNTDAKVFGETEVELVAAEKDKQ